MRRIKEVSDNSNLNVDRRLISNLIVQFMTIPRGDGKRFEILKIIASVLHFNEEEQYRVGLIRRPAGVVGPPTIPNSVAASRRTSMEDPRSPTRGEVQEVRSPRGGGCLSTKLTQNRFLLVVHGTLDCLFAIAKPWGRGRSWRQRHSRPCRGLPAATDPCPNSSADCPRTRTFRTHIWIQALVGDGGQRIPGNCSRVTAEKAMVAASIPLC